MEWIYVINLPAQEYPLKTNAEIVKILKILNGTCSIESVYKVFHKRTNEIYFVNPWSLKVKGTGLLKRPPPYSVVVGKGSAYGAFSRKFVDFAVNDMKAREILKWTEDTFSPDETYWATLAMNKHLGTPGIKYTGKMAAVTKQTLKYGPVALNARKRWQTTITSTMGTFRSEILSEAVC